MPFLHTSGRNGHSRHSQTLAGQWDFMFHWECEIQAFTLSDILDSLNSQSLEHFTHWIS